MIAALLASMSLALLAEVPVPKAQSECASPESLTPAAKIALPKGRWRPENHERLARLIKEHGHGSPRFDPCRRPLAVLDFDNTTIGGDLGEAAFTAAIEEGFFKTGDAFWALIPEAQREEAKKLWPAEGKKADPRLLSVFYRAYEELCRAKGKEVCYPWLVQLFAGRTPHELEAFGVRVAERALAEPDRIDQLPLLDEAADKKPTAVRRGVAIRPEMRELIAAMTAAGFDVYLVSASAEWLIRTFAPRVGVPPERVIGMRTVLEPSGVYGAAIFPPITNGGGKVAAIRTRIAPGGRVPVFAAGDTPNDAEMLDAARFEALLFDRGHPALKAHAEARRWMLQPPFESGPAIEEP